MTYNFYLFLVIVICSGVAHFLFQPQQLFVVSSNNHLLAQHDHTRHKHDIDGDMDIEQEQKLNDIEQQRDCCER